MIRLILILFIHLFHIVSTTTTCFICSSPNIDNHYGSFFENPREIQSSYIGRVNDCEKNQFQTQICDGLCFSLNVSSSDIQSDFGTSYGCAHNLLPHDIDIENDCVTTNIPIRTVPIYSVTATYCTCSSSNCNPPIHPILRKRYKSMKSSQKTVYSSSHITDNNNSISTPSLPLFLCVYLCVYLIL